MNSHDMTLECRYYDGQAPLSVQAKLVFAGNAVELSAGDHSTVFGVNQLRVSPRVGNADRFIILPDGGQCQCVDQLFLDMLPQESRSEGLVAWLETRIPVAIACVAIIAGLLIFGYFYGLPAAAERVAKRIPVETEKALGEQVITWLDDNKWFTPPHTNQKRQDYIRQRFRKLHKGLSMDDHYRLDFRCSELIGPNAFALPGGSIVITDQMIKAAESNEEILAVLAHEIGHVEGHHTLRQILQSSVVGVAAATITADAASLSVAVAGLPAVLTQTKYSRQFEAEADEFAFKLLQKNRISPEAFASLMERLDKEENRFKQFSFLSSHPVTSKRVAKAREASEELGSK